jgi:hypothetical protein
LLAYVYKCQEFSSRPPDLFYSKSQVVFPSGGRSDFPEGVYSRCRFLGRCMSDFPEGVYSRCRFLGGCRSDIPEGVYGRFRFLGGVGGGSAGQIFQRRYTVGVDFQGGRSDIPDRDIQCEPVLTVE